MDDIVPANVNIVFDGYITNRRVLIGLCFRGCIRSFATFGRKNGKPRIDKPTSSFAGLYWAGSMSLELRQDSPVTWLASYPRSGNTLLRIILKRCFGLTSQSLYDDRE